MKAIVYSICMASLALAVTARGEQITTQAKANVKARASHNAPAVQARTSVRAAGNIGRVNTRSNVSAMRYHPSAYTPNRNAIVRQQTSLNNARVVTPRARTLQSSRHVQNNVAVNGATNFNVNRERNYRLGRERNLALNSNQNVTVNREQNFNANRERNVTVNNNWRGQQFDGQNYAAFRNYHREWHDRGWWTSHHPRISFYFGAPYYWDTGYWYPAWGYYPDYVYQYDGPIYGYNGLAPDQVIVDVQSQLQRDGYYSGPIDGVLGPMTRRAIAAFQADHGLAITSTVDEPTLATLGLT